MKSDPDADLLPGEWAVLGVIEHAPGHGFAVARALAPDGALGRVWTMSRPRVYRAIDDLAARRLVAASGTAPSERGPTRTLYAATDEGRARLGAWLAAPVEHVRQMRSDLLLKLALLDAREAAPQQLLERQRAVLVGMLERLEGALAAAEGFDGVVLRYRLESMRGALRFVDEIAGLAPG